MFRRYGPAAASILVVAVWLSACHRADSLLLIEVAGDLNLQPAQLQATISVAGITRPPFLVPPVPRTITLPASFTVEVDRKLTGPVVVVIDAFDGDGGWIASGAARQEHIQVGDDTILVVTLTGTLPAPDDGGINLLESK